MRNISDKSCTENRNAFPSPHPTAPHPQPRPKIVPFMRQFLKIRYIRAGHRLQYNAAYSICVLYT